MVGRATILQSDINFIVGTPLYTSPEICRNEPYNEKTDIWSLGIVFYEIIMLKAPFDAHNLVVLIKRIQKGYYESIDGLIYPRYLIELIDMMLSQIPNERPCIHDIITSLVQQPHAYEEERKLDADNNNDVVIRSRVSSSSDSDSENEKNDSEEEEKSDKEKECEKEINVEEKKNRPEKKQSIDKTSPERNERRQSIINMVEVPEKEIKMKSVKLSERKTTIKRYNLISGTWQ